MFKQLVTLVKGKEPKACILYFLEGYIFVVAVCLFVCFEGKGGVVLISLKFPGIFFFSRLV